MNFSFNPIEFTLARSVDRFSYSSRAKSVELRFSGQKQKIRTRER